MKCVEKVRFHAGAGCDWRRITSEGKQTPEDGAEKRYK
jgi:hypothetical protein